LLTIKAAVMPTAEQMTKIVELYSKLRGEQARIARDARRARSGGTADRGNPAGAPTGSSRDDRAALAQAIRKDIQPANDAFLKSVRAILDPSQHAMWDTVAGAIDLTPAFLRERPDGLNPDLGPKVGEIAPAFDLKNTAGESISLAALRGKPVVVEFGSYSCPIFRNKVERIEKLRQEFGEKVHWVMIYVAEAHPTDGWVVPINTSHGIELAQHTSYEKRVECARLAQETMRLNLHVVVDGFDNAVTKAYSGAPNRAYVLDSEGRIVSKQLWMDPEATEKALRELIEGKR
jgi:hypothetical protein